MPISFKRPYIIWTSLLGIGVSAFLILSNYFSPDRATSVTYSPKSATQPALRMWVYQAKGEGEAYPAVLFFHGGGWVTGSPHQFKWFAERFSACGIVSALVEYRIHSQHGVLPDSGVQDARSAFEWMYRESSRFNVDNSRIALVGGSAGAHIAAASALTCTASSHQCAREIDARPFALGLLNPVLDLTLADATQGYTREELQLIDRLGREKAETLSIGSKLIPLGIPTQLIYGDRDPLLPIARSLLSTDTASSSPNLELLTAPGEAHGFFNVEPWRTSVATALLEFFRAHGMSFTCHPEHQSGPVLRAVASPGVENAPPEPDLPST